MDVSSKPAVLAVVGPTATGKTALSVALARRFGGEILSADSMQIYRGLDIGTAKATETEKQGIPHHMLDILPPEAPFSVADFVALANETAADICARGRLPILAGGTGLYVESFLHGVRFSPDKADPSVRAGLEAELAEKGADALYRELETIDPEAARATHPHNTVRVLRALEHFRATGRTLSAQRAESLPSEVPWRALVLGLDFPDRAALYERIDRRVDRMLEQGLAEEARFVWENRLRFRTAAQAIGYKEFFPYFEGSQTLADCAAACRQASRNYAKRQLTWFRRMPEVQWLDASSPALEQQAETMTDTFLKRECERNA